MVKSPIESRRAIARGAMAGIVAGVFLTLMMTGMSAAGGKDIWYGIKGASAPFFGSRAMQPGFDAVPVVVGFVSHLVISAGWGAIFAIIVEGWNRALTIVGGVLFAFVVWIGMYYLVLPIVGLSSMQDDAPVGRAIAFHLIFTIALTAAYLVYPSIFRRRPGLPHSAHAV
jgi:hypothetical protein